MQKLLSLMRQAIKTYNMIEENDVIAIGVSGGKDSLVLLYAMNALKEFYPKPFEIKAITIDCGFENTDFSEIESLCKKLGVEYVIEKTNIKEIVFDKMREKSPCSLCAKMRRASICQAAKNAGCNKIALGHSLNDATETFVMNVTYNGKAMCFEPVTNYDDIGVTIIRPLIFAQEFLIQKTAKNLMLPVTAKTCPADGNTKREEAKKLILQMKKTNKNVQKNIFTAIKNLPEFKKYEVTDTNGNDDKSY